MDIDGLTALLHRIEDRGHRLCRCRYADAFSLLAMKFSMRIPMPFSMMRRWKSGVPEPWPCGGRCRLTCWTSRRARSGGNRRSRTRIMAGRARCGRTSRCVADVDVGAGEHGRMERSLAGARRRGPARRRSRNERAATAGWVATEHQDAVRFRAPDQSGTFRRAGERWNVGCHRARDGWKASAQRRQQNWPAACIFPQNEIEGAMLRLESPGPVLRGQFRRCHPGDAAAPEWCHRRLLARIHRLTIGGLRKEIEPVSAAEFMSFLLRWQHVAPGARQHGEAGL